jgi:hypothetical protein
MKATPVRMISLFLCLCLALSCYSKQAYATQLEYQSVEEVKQKYSDANIVTVSPAQFEEIKKSETCFEADQAPPPDSSYPPNYERGSHSEGGSGNLNLGSSGGDGGKAILVVLAVVGAVVVAIMVVYAVGYIVKAGANGFRCAKSYEIGYRYSEFSDSNRRQVRGGTMYGAYVNVSYPSPMAKLGLTVETGVHNLKLTTFEKILSPISNEYSGSYLMLGPRFSWELNSNSEIQLEWIGGTSSAQEIGLMSTMRLGYQIQVSENFGLQLGIGAALINVKGYEGYLKESDNLNYLTGFSLAYRWK